MKLSLQAGLSLILVSGTLLIFPNDQAVEKAAGGLVPKREPRVAMKKERLTISPKRIRVEYEFVNESSNDVVTDIAFPIPEYRYPGDFRNESFSDFKLWINDQPASFAIDARAFVSGKDETEILKKNGITIETFGGFDYEKAVFRNGKDFFPDYEVNALPQSVKDELVMRGLVERPDTPYYLAPLWSVRKAYYWTQRFPPGQTVHIRHEYAPIFGFNRISVKSLQEGPRKTCMDKDLLFSKTAMAKHMDIYHDDFPFCWVKYILTSANTWKTPINDFELVTEVALPVYGSFSAPKLISFCWQGKAKISDSGRLLLNEHNFVPTEELTIYFFW